MHLKEEVVEQEKRKREKKNQHKGLRVDQEKRVAEGEGTETLYGYTFHRVVAATMTHKNFFQSRAMLSDVFKDLVIHTDQIDEADSLK